MKTNTKNNVLKLAMTIMATFMFAAAMGQQINHTEDSRNYVEVVEATYQTVGLNFTLYAEPDAFYSPGYDGTGDRGTGLNAASRWRWVYGTAYGDIGAQEVKGWTAQQNWVDITPLSAGSPAAGEAVTFWVKEQFGAAGCEAADAVSHVVNFVGTPSITAFAGTANNGWETVAANDYIKCSPEIAELLVTLEEIGSLPALQEYSYDISVVRRYWDGAAWQPDTGYGTQTINVTAESGYNHTIPNDVTALQYYNDGTNDVATEYLFTLVDNTLKSRISSVSAMRANAVIPTYAGLPTDQIRYVVALAPTTGPIYNIPNNIAL